MMSPNLPIIPITKNPTNVGLDVVKRVELFQQYHLPGLPELASLDHIDVHSRRYRLTKVVGGIPLNRTKSSILLTADQIAHYSSHHIIDGNVDHSIFW